MRKYDPGCCCEDKRYDIMVLVKQPANHLKCFSWRLGTIFRDFQEFSGTGGSAMELLVLDSDIFISMIYCACVVQYSLSRSHSLTLMPV